MIHNQLNFSPTPAHAFLAKQSNTIWNLKSVTRQIFANHHSIESRTQDNSLPMWQVWNSVSIDDGECLICMENEKCLKLDSCNHMVCCCWLSNRLQDKICSECWSQYLKTTISNRFDVKCCGQNCPFKINESVCTVSLYLIF